MRPRNPFARIPEEPRLSWKAFVGTLLYIAAALLVLGLAIGAITVPFLREAP